MINNEQLNKLLPWFGYGHFKEADIVFWGIEEGLGGLPIEAVEARCNVFGNDLKTWINDNDWSNGYWDETGILGTKRLIERTKELLASKNKELPEIKQRSYQGPFLTFSSRMLLSLEKPSFPWFEKKGYYEKNLHHSELWNEINNYVSKGLYNNNHKIKAALIDWRPLPRPTMKVWPYEGLDQKKYDAAFNLNSKYKKNLTSYLAGNISAENLEKDIYLSMLAKRIKLLRNVIESFPFPIMLGVGAPEQKMKAIEVVFSDYNPTFTKYEFSNGKRYYIADINLPNRTLKIILTLFFDNFSNCLQLDGLEELTGIIREHLNEKAMVTN